jgi:hypothetical protein
LLGCQQVAPSAIPWPPCGECDRVAPRNDGADVDGLVERKPDSQSAHAVADLADQRLRDAFLHQQARTGAADLPLVEPDSVDQAFNGAVEIGVVENDEGRFAAELER